MPEPARPVNTSLWLVRHAEVEAQFQGVFGGSIDMGLSPRGRRQAAKLAGYLRRLPLDALYASPMKRVQQTLAPLLGDGVPCPVLRPELREFDFGDWTGLTWAQVRAKFGVTVDRWLDEIEAGAIPNAESTQTLRARLEPCLMRIIQDHPGQAVALVCHGGIIRLVLALLLDWPLPRMARFDIDYASVTQVFFEPNGVQLRLLNFTPWREPGK
jgi:broad specificity phosphatase PhoE